MAHWYAALHEALLRAAKDASGAECPLATLTLDYLAAEEPGADARVDVTITRATRTLVFADAMISAQSNGARLISASAVLKVTA
jgi:hypothetical protein